MQVLCPQTQATTVEAKRRRTTAKNNPAQAVGLRGILAEWPLDWPDPVSYAGPDGAEHDRQASLEFLHHLVMGSESD